MRHSRQTDPQTKRNCRVTPDTQTDPKTQRKDRITPDRKQTEPQINRSITPDMQTDTQICTRITPEKQFRRQTGQARQSSVFRQFRR